MRKLVLLTLVSLKLVAQTDTRTFPITVSSIQYSMGTSAPIVPTPDNGYLLNFAYSYPNLDVAPGYQTTIIKTDADFVPLWSKPLYGGNGKKTIVLNDGSSLFFTDLGVIEKLDANGQTVFSKGDFTTYPVRLYISDAAVIGSIIKAVGSVDTYNGFGYITTSIPIIIDFDSDGNVLQTYVLTDSVSTYTRPTQITATADGTYYLSGYSYSNGNYICKVNSSNTVLWCKQFKPVINYSPINLNDLLILSNGDLSLGGYFYNYDTSFGGLYLGRLTSNGDYVSAKTTDVYPSAIYTLTQLASGDLVATGTMREDYQATNKTFSMRMSSDETLSWVKIYNEGFGISAPFVKSDNEWYYTAFHNNNISNNNPILFHTENNGTMTCPNDDFSVSLIDVPLNFSTISLTLTPNASLLGVPYTAPSYDAIAQNYIDECIPRLLSINEVANTPTVLVYPNPSTGTLQIDSQSEILSIALFNALGQELKTYYPKSFESSFTIGQNGLYLLRIETTTGIKNTKIIISN